jgi:thioredoxin 1
MGKLTVDVTDASFEQDVIGSEQAVLVDFWASWCQPCKMIAPHLDALAETMSGELKVAKLDVDANPNTQERFEVSGIPTLLLFKSGKLVGRFVGFRTKDRLEVEVKRALEAVKA